MKMLVLFIVMCVVTSGVMGKVIDKRKCPEVRAVPHFDLPQVCSLLHNIKEEKVKFNNKVQIRNCVLPELLKLLTTATNVVEVIIRSRITEGSFILIAQSN